MKQQEIIRRLNRLPKSQLIDIYNHCCDETDTSEYMIYKMGDIDNVFEDTPIINVLFMAHDGGSFDPNDNYFRFDEQENLESCEDLFDFLDVNALAEYLEYYDDSDLEYILSKV